jgi:hypothetical protein
MTSHVCSAVVVLALSVAAPVVRAADAAEPLRYAFAPMGDPPSAVKVTLGLKGHPSGVSRFQVQPHWGGVEHCERGIHALGPAPMDRRCA